MFVGLHGQRIIYASHPFLVMVGENSSGSFATLEEAERFIAKQASYSAFILRHNGQEWVIARDRLIDPLLGPDRLGITRSKPGDHRR
jgi:hypothetical protein